MVRVDAQNFHATSVATAARVGSAAVVSTRISSMKIYWDDFTRLALRRTLTEPRLGDPRALAFTTLAGLGARAGIYETDGLWRQQESGCTGPLSQGAETSPGPQSGRQIRRDCPTDPACAWRLTCARTMRPKERRGGSTGRCNVAPALGTFDESVSRETHGRPTRYLRLRGQTARTELTLRRARRLRTGERAASGGWRQQATLLEAQTFP